MVRSLANYSAETGFAPATFDVFIEAPMTAVDRANLDLVLPQIAAQNIFVRPAEHDSRFGWVGFGGNAAQSAPSSPPFLLLRRQPGPASCTPCPAAQGQLCWEAVTDSSPMLQLIAAQNTVLSAAKHGSRFAGTSLYVSCGNDRHVGHPA